MLDYGLRGRVVLVTESSTAWVVPTAAAFTRGSARDLQPKG
jgi:hypothetical protein